jgi:hypothetical protein
MSAAIQWWRASRGFRKGVRMERLTNSDKEIPTLVNNAEYWLEVYFKLKDIEDAEEQGLLLRLPCKVGDKLYRITPYAKEPIITTHVLQINIKQFFNEKIIVRIDVMDKMGESCYFLDDIGKKVFLSRAEAEAKLAEMEGAE